MSRAVGEELGGQVGVILEPDVAGHAGAHAQLLDLVALDLQDRGRQAVEQVVEEHGAQRPAKMVLEQPILEQFGRLHRVEQPQHAAAGMLGQHAVPARVEQHARRAVRGDVAEAVVIIVLVLRAEVPERVEEIAGKQADADAQFQHEQFVFQRAHFLGVLKAGEEDLGGITRQRAIIVDEKRNGHGVGQKRLVAALAEIFLAEVPFN